MVPDVLVIAEHNGVEIDPATFELITWARAFSTDNGWHLGVLLCGFGTDKFTTQLRDSGADIVFVWDDTRLQQYNASNYLHAVARAIRQTKPKLVILRHSYFGIEMGAGLAVDLQAPLVSNCLSVVRIDDGFAIRRPSFGGTMIMELHVHSASSILLSMQKGFAHVEKARSSHAEIASLDISDEIGTPALRVVRETQPTFGGNITKSKIIIAVGRGIGDSSKLDLFRELAQKLGAALAASRPIIDMGWLPADHQVGLSGQTVKPNVYVAFGISGAAQHVAGMRDAGLIIAINKDASAPIFQVAHYGVVGDLFDVAPRLLRIANGGG
jgi:electron transfer flavoprotein alpha subunit